jgi:leucyl-tRNA synthetase
VQVNGKVRGEITIAKDLIEAQVKDLVMEMPEVIKWMEGKPLKKFIYVPGKIINVVV